MDHRLDLRCHRFLHICSPLEVEGEAEAEAEEELSIEVVLEMVGQVMV